MKKFTALAFVAGLTATSAQAGNYDLIYDATTGNLSIQTNIDIVENSSAAHPVVAKRNIPASGNMINYVLESTDDVILTGGRALKGAVAGTIAVEEIAPGFFFATGTVGTTTKQLAESNSNLVTNGAKLHNIGNVLPAGLSQAQFLAAFDKQATYVRNLGTPVLNFDLVYVPEPTSLALLGLGGLMVARRRRA